MAKHELGSLAIWILKHLDELVITEMRAEHKTMNKSIALQKLEELVDCVERQSDRVEFTSRVLFLLSHGQHKAAEEMILSVVKKSED
jgi:hypothetical protein